jgi:Xaa-Pro aminopeptidase
MDYKQRQRRLEGSLPDEGLDVLLVTHLPNIRYLCGFTGSAGVLLLQQEHSRFFTDSRYTQQARAEVEGVKVEIGGSAPLSLAAGWMGRNRKHIGSRRLARIGVEGEHLSSAAVRRLSRMLPSGCRLRQSSQLVERWRMVKDAEEIARLRSAAGLGSDLFRDLLRALGRRTSEMEVAADLEFAARRAGADGMSFPTIVAAGKLSSLPHGVATQLALPARGFVVCDFGVILAGYCSDMTRTVHMGPPTALARKVYAAVERAEQAAIEAVKPGVSVAEVDRAARRCLEKSGLGRFFTHSTGHGVGLEIHEAPRIASEGTERLEAGMVITIEPGAYLPGKFGVRIEDMVAVTEHGCEVLTPTTKELVVF